jgi:hypothetical protein
MLEAPIGGTGAKVTKGQDYAILREKMFHYSNQFLLIPRITSKSSPS